MDQPETDTSCVTPAQPIHDPLDANEIPIVGWCG
jgi:hypothetical protein